MRRVAFLLGGMGSLLPLFAFIDGKGRQAAHGTHNLNQRHDLSDSQG